MRSLSPSQLTDLIAPLTRFFYAMLAIALPAAPPRATASR